MIARKILKSPESQIRFGLIFLGIASLSKWGLESHSSVPENWSDPIIGFLYGISIALMLMGIWRKKNARQKG